MFLEGYGYLIFQGAWLTVQVATWAACVAIVLGLLGALAKLSPMAPLRLVATVYTTLVRSVPDLVLMLLIYYSAQIGINQIAQAFGRESLQLNPYGTAIGTLGFIYGAYCTETFRGAFRAIPFGQLEAARAYGMSHWQVLRRIRLPQMMRFALPGIGNIWQVLLKSAGLISLLGLNDMVQVAKQAGNATSRQMFFYLVIAAIFLAFAILSSLALKHLERRYSIEPQRSAS
ncbi:ABC transporter permease subunit [Pseudomonas sp. SWRI12]|uniref:ABC transporter permease subunit n=1 Tax=Pseudomonas zanjanensis TaxID=2745496 RepID=A0A923FFM9_9PSED|nr:MULTISPECIES: ABC transporter permease subunit [Pseudomonas]MBC3383926.1 ABC transporter permease subunit [Pseudomonas sp. SWRI179]MBV4495056.1 ABC transporter permease subunit [Pseudomonas zanjanensis]